MTDVFALSSSVFIVLAQRSVKRFAVTRASGEDTSIDLVDEHALDAAAEAFSVVSGHALLVALCAADGSRTLSRRSLDATGSSSQLFAPKPNSSPAEVISAALSLPDGRIVLGSCPWSRER